MAFFDILNRCENSMTLWKGIKKLVISFNQPSIKVNIKRISDQNSQESQIVNYKLLIHLTGLYLLEREEG